MADVYEDEVSGNAVVLPALTDSATYTPVPVGFGTVTALSMEWRQSLTKTLLSGKFTQGTSTGVQAQLPLPSGQTIGTFAGVSGTFVVGKWALDNATANTIKQGVLLGTTGNTYLTFGFDDNTTAIGPLNPRNGTNFPSGTIVIDGEAVIPIAEFQALGGYRAYGAGLVTSEKAGLVSYEGLGTHSTTFTWNGSGGTTSTIAIDYSRLGKSVTLNIPRAVVISGTASTVLLANTALPVSLRPKVDTCVLVRTREANAATNIVGQLTIYTTGVIELVRLGAAWANASAGSGFEFTSVSYVVA